VARSAILSIVAVDLPERSATALIDRVVHHAVHHADVIAIEGDSYRRRDAETAKRSRRGKA